ncbi:Overproducer of inositol [Hyphodiscus hymeniophilus]|uniref:Overproducer of inositol n=1 Tax=Hyphodiscus hymeniophilus TaxID=353542 RepID=A0A9P7B0Z1_9HELO|nr:Overproducer of inositol [Hyphodiscus hymeniophilus]
MADPAANPLPQLFGILPTGLPPITTPTSAPTPTSFLFTLPPRTYSHIAVFILPGITLPPDSAAAVYLQIPPPERNAGPLFKFLGGIGPGKESAIFKISGLVGGTTGGAGNVNGEVDMDAPETGANGQDGEVTLGISLESAASVSSQMAALRSSSSTNPSSALVLSRPTKVPTEQEVKVKLAQKIVKNAFNFLASYSGNLQNGVEVVPLKAFEEWWRKFEGRVRSDPGFLERDEGD